MNSEFASIFARLRSILEPHAARLKLTADAPDHYCLDVPFIPKLKKGFPVAWVKVGKSYVSYHFMPMYMFPKLRDGRSKKLRARMQGKACFNFKVGDEPLFKELEQLTAKGFASAAKRALDRDRAMPATITTERPDTADARALIEELEAHLATLYPQESRHGYSVEKLIAQGVAFFATRNNGTPVGCGGIQLFGTEYGELKRMYVPAQFRGLGFAKLMLNHLADFARSREVRLLRLETGIHQHAAIGLYERDRFRSIPPFGEYKDDPLSSLYEKRIV